MHAEISFSLLSSSLLKWYKENARALPWRTDYEPYHVFISELMLQQTQMERGVEYFNRWLKLFPTIFDVASASEEEIMHAWEGLGYYRRARYLHETAKKICDEHQGTIPADSEILKTFKGLGDYTIAAICGIAYNQDIVTIDANVDRVFSRLFCIEGDTKKNPAKSKIKELAYACLPKGEARLYNQSLMELGALICKKNPLCDLCPIAKFCQAKKNGNQSSFPSPKEKQKLIYEEWIELIFITKNNEIYIQQREKHLHWGGLFVFYPMLAKSREHLKIVKDELIRLFSSQAPLEKKLDFQNQFTIEHAITQAYSYTNHRNTASFYKIHLDYKLEKELEATEFFSNFKKVTSEDLEKIAFPSPYRKAIQEIF